MYGRVYLDRLLTSLDHAADPVTGGHTDGVFPFRHPLAPRRAAVVREAVAALRAENVPDGAMIGRWAEIVDAVVHGLETGLEVAQIVLAVLALFGL